MQNEDGNNSPLRGFFRQKWVLVILAFNILAILATIGILVWQATKVSTINLNIAPVDATISVNGDTNYTNGQFAITPGTYNITISREGLESKTFTVDIAPQHVNTITTFLAGADNNFEFYELKDHYESYQKLISIASADNNITTDQDFSAKQFISDYEHTLSFFKKLPIKGYVYADPNINNSTAGFTIQNGSSKEECKKTACLFVNYYGVNYREAVFERIKEAGYEPEDYQILYERYN